MASVEGLNYYQRTSAIPPPGVNTACLPFLKTTHALNEAVKSEKITPGQHDLALGLLVYGGIKMFDLSMGLDYENVFKKNFDVANATPALGEMAQEMQKVGVDMILAPDYSAAVPAALLSSVLQVPLVRVEKNAKDIKDAYAVKIDSYTSGEVDILSVGKKRLKAAVDQSKKKGILKIWVADDILDTGTMVDALKNIIDQAKKERVQIELVGVATLFEKLYTKAGENIRKNLNIPVVSGLAVEDIGMDPQWMRIKGVDQSLGFQSE